MSDLSERLREEAQRLADREAIFYDTEALLREAADALDAAEKERDEARERVHSNCSCRFADDQTTLLQQCMYHSDAVESAWQQGVIEFEREALDLVNLWQMKDELAVVRFREALRDARRNIEAPALPPQSQSAEERR